MTISDVKYVLYKNTMMKIMHVLNENYACSLSVHIIFNIKFNERNNTMNTKVRLLNLMLCKKTCISSMTIIIIIIIIIQTFCKAHIDPIPIRNI